jgi:serine protease AprX
VVAATDSTFMYSSGTSFSSPIMAGLVACLWQAKPEVSVAQLYTAIEMSASRSTNPDTLIGYGIPDFSLALQLLGMKDKKRQVNSVYPNPFTQDLSIRCFSNTGEENKIFLYNQLGQIILQKTNYLLPGENSFNINPGSNCPPGQYVLQIISDHFSESFRLVKIVK